MKKIKLLLFGTIFCSYSYAQNNVLKVIFVDHHEMVSNDSLVKSLQHFISDIKQKAPNFNYSNVSYNLLDFNRSPELVEESTIGSMKAANFNYCNGRLKNKLIPILIVKKNNQELPYYTSYFIVNKNSQIESINSPDIKRVIYVDKQSASGFIIPIHQMWESGVITKPSLAAAIEKFGEDNVIPAGSHQEVIRRIGQNSEFNSIGLCGEIPDSSSISKILLRYSYLPQDVIFVSQNLKQYIPQIKEWFEIQAKNGIFRNTSTHITGLVDFDLEYKAAYENLKSVMERVEFCELNPSTKKFKYADLNTPSQLFNFLKELTFAELGAIIALMITVFYTGATIATKYPKILEILKSKNGGS